MQIPFELSSRPNWVVWRTIVRGDKKTKLPFSPLTFHLASSTDPKTWATLDEARTALMTQRFAGLGFVFAKDDCVFGLDLDSCYATLTDLHPWAADLLRSFWTYAEVSPSGRGVKVFAIGEHQTKGCVKPMGDPVAGGKRSAIEVYGWGRYFAFTGLRLDDSPAELKDCRRPLAKLVQSIKPVRPASPATRTDAQHSTPFGPVERARAYLRKVPPRSSSLAGCNNRTFRAACVLVHDLKLEARVVFALMAEWNQRSDDPWTDAELWRKVVDATKKKSS